MGSTTPSAYEAQLSQLRRVRLAKDAMDRDWAEPIDLDAVAAHAGYSDYEAMKARGVEFLQKPQERPYGTEAIFRDDSGNWFSFTQRRAQLDLSKNWSQ